MLAVIETHPIQYHVPVYRALQQRHGVPVTAIYGSDFSLRRYRDREFGAEIDWDVDLLGGIRHDVLAPMAPEGGSEPGRIGTRGLGAALDRVRPSAALIVGYSPAFHRRAWRTVWRRGLPILFRGEVSDIVQTPRPVVTLARDLALRVAYRSCARLLYIGQRARRHFVDHGVDEERLGFSPYCVDTTPFRTSEQDRTSLRSEARAALRVADGSLVLLFAGKLSDRKGIDLIVPAVRMLPEPTRGRVTIVCLGDGAGRAALEAAAAEAPAVPLTVLGVRPQHELSRWYHASDLLVLPSRRGETWGLVVNEALHHGLPVVVSDRVGCAVDLVDGATGATCAADSAEALAGAILAASALAGRDETRAACRRRVDGYSVEAAAAGLARAYQAATRGRSVA